MASYMLDSWAWVEYLQGTNKGEKVRRVLKERDDFFTSAISLAEVVSKASRSGQEPRVAWQAITTNSRIVVPSSSDAYYNAGLLHGELKTQRPNFSLGDAFVLAAARARGAKIITGDPDFEGVPEAIML
jgi:predicted nucleic acid-binding protein